MSTAPLIACGSRAGGGGGQSAIITPQSTSCDITAITEKLFAQLQLGCKSDEETATQGKADGQDDIGQPKELLVNLLPYQKAGLRWMTAIESNSMEGGMLAGMYATSVSPLVFFFSIFLILSSSYPQMTCEYIYVFSPTCLSPVVLIQLQPFPFHPFSIITLLTDIYTNTH